MPRNHNNAIAAPREAKAAGLLVSEACQGPFGFVAPKVLRVSQLLPASCSQRRAAAFAPQNKSNCFESGFQIVN